MTNFSYEGSTHLSYTLSACRSPTSAAPLVLIVEDHEDTRFMLHTILETAGIRVAEAVDGEEGARAAEALRPDLVLMDGSLPCMDGLASTRRIREREEGRKVPIIFVSGHADPASQAEAFAAGCDAYLVKPIELNELNRVLEAHLCREMSLHLQAT